MDQNDFFSFINISVSVIIAIVGGMLILIFRMNYMLIEIIQRLSTVEVKVDVLWRDYLARAHSPIAPNKRGREILLASTFRHRLELSYEQVLQKIRAAQPRSAYEVQEKLIVIVSSYQYNDDYRFGLHEDAFNSGSTIEDVLFVTALSIRDRVMTDLGFETARGSLVADLHNG